MPFYKRGFLYLMRKRGKSVLLLLIFLFVNSMILSTNMILHATESTEAAMQEKAGAKVVCEISDTANPITDKEAEMIKNLAEVTSINRMGQQSAYLTDLAPVTASASTEPDNVKVGLHNQVKYGVASGIFRLPGYFRDEKYLDERAKELLDVFGLYGERDYLASNLPYGKQRKLEIARALATGPKLLLLDEPAAGMNPNETAELMETIHFVRDTFNMTILLIEHDMKLVSGICEEITVLNFGQVLAQGKPSDVLNDPKVIVAYLGE